MPRLLLALCLSTPLFAQPAPRADLAVEAYIVDRLSVGETFVANVTLRNLGPDAARDVVLTTSAGRFQGPGCPGGETGRCAIAVFASGADRSLLLHIDREGVAGRVPLTIEVTGSVEDPSPRNNRVSSEVEFLRAPRMRISIYGAGGGVADPGGTVEYQATIWNESSIPAQNARFTVPLREGWSFEKSLTDDLRCAVAGRSLTCTVATIGPHAAHQSRFVLRAPDLREGSPYATEPVELTTDQGVLANELTTAYFPTVIYRHIAVTNTGDEGEGSLRNAIATANAECGAYPAPPCRIVFDIAGGGSHQTIRPLSPLPVITQFVSIDGSTQTARHGDTNPLGPEIEINGSLLAAGDGFDVTAGSLQLRDMVINGFPGNGVTIRESGFGRSIARCYIGTDVTGTKAVPNARGVVVDIQGTYNSAYLSLYDNVISGNTRAGVFLASAFEATIAGNRIGASAGERPEPLPNGASGIYAGPRASAVVIRKNLIAFNGEAGIATSPTTGYILIRANAITGNGGLGIDYGLDLVTPGGSAPPFPVITSARHDEASGVTRIEGTIDSRYGAAITEVELFANNAPGVAGHGEGELFLGRVPTATGATFTLDYKGDLRGRYISGTYTQANNYYPEAPYLLTSEFGPSVRVEGEAAAPIDVAAMVPRGADLRIGLAATWRLLAGTREQIRTIIDNLGPDSSGPVVVEITADAGRLESRESRCTAISPTALRCELPSVEQQLSFTLETPLDAGNVTMRARVTPTTLDPDLTNNETSITLPVTAQPGLEVKVDSPGPVDPGAEATYAVHVLHRTGVDARDVAVRIPLPRGWSVASGQCGAEGEHVVCRTPHLEAGRSRSFVYTLRAPANEGGVRGFTSYVRISAAGGVLYEPFAWAVYEVFHILRVTTAADEGSGSLRDAITRANHECGPQGMNCKIVLDPAGPASIRPARPLPRITATDFTIDARRRIEINGSQVATGNGLELSSEGRVVIRGLAINGFPENGIVVRRQGFPYYNARRTIIDNYIGTDLTGRTAVPNGGRGIVVESESQEVTDVDILSNVISGNARAGVFVASGARIRITGNRIGLNVDDDPLPNGASGIYAGRAENVQIENNSIAHNLHAGIAIDRNAHWTGISGNSVWSNGSLGVDHGLDLVTFNDDTGRREDLPRFPVILSATWDAAAKVTRIEGRVEDPRLTGIIELFANAEPDATGYGEAQRSLGQLEIRPSQRKGEEQAFTFTLAEDLRGQFVTATLTRRSSFTQSWTSEIGQAVPVQ